MFHTCVSYHNKSVCVTKRLGMFLNKGNLYCQMFLNPSPASWVLLMFIYFKVLMISQKKLIPTKLEI